MMILLEATICLEHSAMNYGGLYCVKESDGTKGRLIQDSDIIYISDGDKAAVKYLYRFGGYYY